ncbi:MAG TPA: flagellar biosynthetic protein FliO [Aeromonadales bacterium]|nr:flagellar biosynthetic protein FliO [Aeromonadales bacterium]
MSIVIFLNRFLRCFTTLRGVFFTQILLSQSLYAENNVLAKTSSSSVAGGISAMQISQILGGLLLVLFVIFWGAWLAKKLKFGAKISGNGLIKILSYLPLGTREKLILVSVGDEQILISSSPQGISHIHTLQKNIIIPENEAESTSSFAVHLSQILQKKSLQKNQQNDKKNRDQ